MSNYRIHIEQINPDVELPEELRGGVCVDGFTLIYNEQDRGTVAIQHMTTLDVARSIESCATMRAAARIAEGLHEAAEIERKDSMDELFGNCASLPSAHRRVTI